MTTKQTESGRIGAASKCDYWDVLNLADALEICIHALETGASDGYAVKFATNELRRLELI